MPSNREEDRALCDAALRGDAVATRELIRTVLPIVQARIARILSRRRGGSGRDIRQEVEDLSQEVFASLFANDARILRAWDPDRGLALGNFCGLIAEREATSILRSGRRSPWTESATELDEIEADLLPVANIELQISSREQLDLLLERLREALSPRGLELFQRLIVDDESPAEVGASTGMSVEAVYAWKSRLGKVARKIAFEVSRSEPNQRSSESLSDDLADTRRAVREVE